MKKSLLWLLIMVLAVSMIATFSLAGCKKAAEEEAVAPAEEEAVEEEVAVAEVTEEPITITMWNGFNEHEVGLLDEVIAKYWAPAHPNITVETKGAQNIESMLTAMAGGEPPDVILSPETQVVGLWAKQGGIMDMTDFIQAKGENLDELLVKAGLQWVVFNDKYYGLPFVNFNWGLYYNKDLFEAAGLDPELPPTTTDELTEYAKALTIVDENGEITQLGWLPIMFNGDNTINFAMNFGGEFVDPVTLEPTLNNPKIVEAFDYDVALANEFGLDKVVGFVTGFTEGDNPFALGKAAMFIDGCWMTKFLPEGLNFGVGSIPASDPQYAMGNNVGTNPLVVPVGAKNPDAAMEFVYFMSTNPDVAREYSDLIANIPQVKSVLGNFSEDPRTVFFGELSNSANAKAWAPVLYANEYLDQLITTTGDIYNNGMSPQEALDMGQENIKAIYDADYSE